MAKRYKAGNDLQAEMGCKGMNSPTGVGMHKNPRSAKASSTASPRSRTPTSITGTRDYDRAFGGLGSVKKSAIRRGY